MIKNADVMIAWAHGIDVEHKVCGTWYRWPNSATIPPPVTNDDEWRIKPTPKPDVVQGWHVKQDFDYMRSSLPH